VLSPFFINILQFFFNLQNSVLIFLESGQLTTNRWILLLLMLFVCAFGPSGWSLFRPMKQNACVAHFWKPEVVGLSSAETVRAVEWAHHSSGVWFILLNEGFRWSPLTRHTLSKHIKINWSFGMQSLQLRLICCSHTFYVVKFRTLLGSSSRVCMRSRALFSE